MSAYQPDSTDQLYDSLPEVYRNKDKPGPDGSDDNLHLRSFLGAMGHVLDLTRNTLEQRYADSFAGLSDDGDSCQDWLIPYFADLLAVELQSPDPNGQRAEVANSVKWAQRKGTLGATEEIIEAITQGEGEIQEGWKRVATTARIGLPLPTAIAMGESQPMWPDAGVTDNPGPQMTARHPGIRAITPDMRFHSRAIEVAPGHPNSQTWSGEATGRVWPSDDFDAVVVPRPKTDRIFWRQVNPHGAPCFPGTYQDVSARTPDLRDPIEGQGGYHPKRVIIYFPPPVGLCAADPISFTQAELLALPVIDEGEDGFGELTDLPINDDDTPSIPPVIAHFVTRMRLEDGTEIFRNKTSHSLVITGNFDLAGPHLTRFEKLRFTGHITISGGRSAFRRCAIKRLTSTAPETVPSPVISFQDCLIDVCKAPANSVQCEYVTVLTTIEAGRLLASDCIFVGSMGDEAGIVNMNDCVRYSRVSEVYFGHMVPTAQKAGITTAAPVFVETEFCKPGCGVLSGETDTAILNGAEDGGEMGVFHAWRHYAQFEALRRKLADFLSVGIEPVIVRDATLNCKPAKPAP